MRKLLLCSVSSLLLSSPALADVITATITDDGNPVIIAGGSDSLDVSTITFGSFQINPWNGYSHSALGGKTILGTTTINIINTVSDSINHQIIIDIKDVGIIGFLGANDFVTKFSITNFNNWTVELQSFVGNSQVGDTGLFPFSTLDEEWTGGSFASIPMTAELRYIIDDHGMAGELNASVGITDVGNSPEPATWVMMLLGLATVGLTMRALRPGKQGFDAVR